MTGKATLAKRARQLLFQLGMADRKQFRIRTSRFPNRAGKREAFKIAVSVPRREHGTDGTVERVLGDAEKIFEDLVRSGRLPRRKK